MYWRLLTTNPTAARDIVLSEKPVISTETDRMDKGMLDQLLLHTGTLGSIYHKNPETFIRTAKPRYLPDSPALNSSSRRHLVQATALFNPRPTPAVPARPAPAPVHTAAASNGNGNGDAPPSAASSSDPYAQLADLDLLGGNNYQSDVPRPRGAAEDLLV
jgi:hypothetical protein